MYTSLRARRLDPTRLFRRAVDEVAGGGGGGAGGGGGVDRAKIDALTGKPTVDVNAKVVVDGKEMTVGDLIAAQKATTQAAADAAKAAADLKTLEAKMASVLRGDSKANRAAMETDYRELLVRAGATAEEVEARVAAAFPAPKKGKAEPAPVDDDEGDELGEDEGEESPELKMYRDLAAQQLDMAGRDAVQRALGNTEYKAFMDGINLAFKHEGDKECQERVTVWKQKIVEATTAHMNALIAEKRARTGKISLDWYNEAAEEALKKSLGAARKLVGDPRRLGNSASAAETDPFIKSVTGKEPVKLPSYTDPKQRVPGQTDRMVAAAIADGIKRAVAGKREKERSGTSA